MTTLAEADPFDDLDDILALSSSDEESSKSIPKKKSSTKSNNTTSGSSHIVEEEKNVFQDIKKPSFLFDEDKKPSPTAEKQESPLFSSFSPTSANNPTFDAPFSQSQRKEQTPSIKSALKSLDDDDDLDSFLPGLSGNTKPVGQTSVVNASKSTPMSLFKDEKELDFMASLKASKPTSEPLGFGDKKKQDDVSSSLFDEASSRRNRRREPSNASKGETDDLLSLLGLGDTKPKPSSAVGKSTPQLSLDTEPMNKLPEKRSARSRDATSPLSIFDTPSSPTKKDELISSISASKPANANSVGRSQTRNRSNSASTTTNLKTNTTTTASLQKSASPLLGNGAGDDDFVPSFLMDMGNSSSDRKSRRPRPNAEPTSPVVEKPVESRDTPLPFGSPRPSAIPDIQLPFLDPSPKHSTPKSAKESLEQSPLPRINASDSFIPLEDLIPSTSKKETDEIPKRETFKKQRTPTADSLSSLPVLSDTDDSDEEETPPTKSVSASLPFLFDGDSKPMLVPLNDTKPTQPQKKKSIPSKEENGSVTKSDQVVSELEKTIRKLNEELVESKREISKLQKSLEDIKDSHTKEIEQLKSSHETTLSSIQETHNSTIDALKTQHAESISQHYDKIKLDLEVQFAEKQKEQLQEIQNLLSMAENVHTLSDITTKLNNNSELVTQLQEKLDSERLRSLEEREKSLSALQDQLIAERSLLDAEKTTLKQERQDLETRKRSFGVEKTVFEAQLEAEKKSLEAERSSLVMEREKLLGQLSNERQQITHDRQNWELDRQRLFQKLLQEEKELSETKAELSLLKRMLSQERDEVTKTQVVAKNQLENEQKAFEREITAHHAKIAELQRESAFVRAEKQRLECLAGELEIEREVLTKQKLDVEKQFKTSLSQLSESAKEKDRVQDMLSQIVSKTQQLELMTADLHKQREKIQQERENLLNDRLAVADMRVSHRISNSLQRTLSTSISPRSDELASSGALNVKQCITEPASVPKPVEAGVSYVHKIASLQQQHVLNRKLQVLQARISHSSEASRQLEFIRGI